MDKLVDDIIEFILEDMSCYHEDDGICSSVEYSLNNEAKVRDKIVALIKKPEVTEEWIEEWGVKLDYSTIFSDKLGTVDVDRDVLKDMLEEAGVSIAVDKKNRGKF